MIFIKGQGAPHWRSECFAGIHKRGPDSVTNVFSFPFCPYVDDFPTSRSSTEYIREGCTYNLTQDGSLNEGRLTWYFHIFQQLTSRVNAICNASLYSRFYNVLGTRTRAPERDLLLSTPGIASRVLISSSKISSILRVVSDPMSPLSLVNALTSRSPLLFRWRFPSRPRNIQVL